MNRKNPPSEPVVCNQSHSLLVALQVVGVPEHVADRAVFRVFRGLIQGRRQLSQRIPDDSSFFQWGLEEALPLLHSPLPRKLPLVPVAANSVLQDSTLREAVAALSEQDQTRLSQCYRDHAGSVLNRLRRSFPEHIASDALHLAFIVIAERPYVLDASGSIRAFLHTTARRKALALLAPSRREGELPEEAQEPSSEPEESLGHRRAIVAAFIRTMLQLKHRRLYVVHRRFVCGRTVEQTALDLGMSESSVKRMTAEARRKLRASVRREQDLRALPIFASFASLGQSESWLSELARQQSAPRPEPPYEQMLLHRLHQSFEPSEPCSSSGDGWEIPDVPPAEPASAPGKGMSLRGTLPPAHASIPPFLLGAALMAAILAVVDGDLVDALLSPRASTSQRYAERWLPHLGDFAPTAGHALNPIPTATVPVLIVAQQEAPAAAPPHAAPPDAAEPDAAEPMMNDNDGGTTRVRSGDVANAGPPPITSPHIEHSGSGLVQEAALRARVGGLFEACLNQAQTHLPPEQVRLPCRISFALSANPPDQLCSIVVRKVECRAYPSVHSCVLRRLPIRAACEDSKDMLVTVGR